MQEPSLHWAFGPHGDGLHGSDGASVTATGGSSYTLEGDQTIRESFIFFSLLFD